MQLLIPAWDTCFWHIMFIFSRHFSSLAVWTHDIWKGPFVIISYTCKSRNVMEKGMNWDLVTLYHGYCGATFINNYVLCCQVVMWQVAPQNLSINLTSSQWHHNECDYISNHQRFNCLLSRLFRCRSKKTSKLCVTGLCEGNSPVTGEFPSQRASNTENVSIW